MSVAVKTALVTGASRGIGRAIARQLAGQGVFVLAHYGAARAAADSLVAEIEAGGGRAAAIGADLALPTAPADLAARALALLPEGKLDILVNNAGISIPATIEDVTPEDFARVMQVNLHSPFFLIQALLPHIRDGGRIINVSTLGVRAAYPTMTAYAPTKAAMEALTLLLAQHLGPRGITVNAVRPGATVTDMNARLRDPETAKSVATAIALGRVGQPDDVAAIVAFLASDAGRWLTGQTLDASGGQRL